MLVDILIAAAVFLVLMFLSVPVSFCIALSTTLLLLFNLDVAPAAITVAQRLSTGLDNFAFLAVPFFILAGAILERGGIARRIIDFAKGLVGALPGGLGFVNIFANMMLAAIEGSAIATASAMGSIMHPEMVRNGYDRKFSAAVNISSANMGLIIPPSNPMIVLSMVSGVSVTALFFAGYLPGILWGLSLMVPAGIIAYRQGYGRGETVGARELLRRFGGAVVSLTFLVVLMGGVLAGIFTATEAAAIAVVYALFLSMVVYRELKPRDLPAIILGAAKTSAVVMMLVATSMGLSWALAYLNIPQSIGEALIAVSSNKLVILLIINLVLLVVGLFMDMTPAILVFTPIFLPVATSLGVDPLHFDIIMIVNLCIGLCTPPVATVLFAGCSVANVSITEVQKPLLPMYAAMLVTLLIITFVPDVALTVPRFFGLWR